MTIMMVVITILVILMIILIVMVMIISKYSMPFCLISEIILLR